MHLEEHWTVILSIFIAWSLVINRSFPKVLPGAVNSCTTNLSSLVCYLSLQNASYLKKKICSTVNDKNEHSNIIQQDDFLKPVNSMSYRYNPLGSYQYSI